MNKRTSVPEEIRRQLRREANFACAICGSIPIELHHIIPVAERSHNDPEHMIYLCRNHHGDADRNAINREELYEIKRKIKDNKAGAIRGKLAVNTNNIPILKLGSAFFENFHIPLMIDNIPVIEVGVSYGNVFINANFYGPNDELIARIRENEWIVFHEDIKDIKGRFWDIQDREKKLKILHKKKGYYIAIEIQSVEGVDVIEITGKLQLHGTTVKLTKDSACIDNGADVSLCCTGIVNKTSDNYKHLLNLPMMLVFPNTEVAISCNTITKSIGMGVR